MFIMLTFVLRQHHEIIRASNLLNIIIKVDLRDRQVPVINTHSYSTTSMQYGLPCD